MSRFVPTFPSHAIQRCVATVAFDNVLPAKMMDTVTAGQDMRLAAAGLTSPQASSFSVQIDIATGKVDGTATAGSPRVYVTEDKTGQLFVLPNSIQWMVTSYVRWQTFVGQFRNFALPLIQAYAAAVDISAVKLEYLDRFFWNGTWQDLDPKELLKLDGGYIAEESLRYRPQWHTHSGWFERRPDDIRRLVNVNIDAADARPPNSTVATPSISILTRLQEQPFPGAPRPPVFDDPDRSVALLSVQHDDLKLLLSRIILPDMAKRIGLVG